jgi:hypothetical protein
LVHVFTFTRGAFFFPEEERADTAKGDRHRDPPTRTPAKDRQTQPDG